MCSWRWFFGLGCFVSFRGGADPLTSSFSADIPFDVLGLWISASGASRRRAPGRVRCDGLDGWRSPVPRQARRQVANVAMHLLQFWGSTRDVAASSCVLSRRPHVSSLSLRRLRLGVAAQASRCFCKSRRRGVLYHVLSRRACLFSAFRIFSRVRCLGLED